MRKCNRKLANGKQIVLRKGDEVYVGVDAHKKDDHVAVLRNGREVATWVMPHGNEAMVKALEPMKKHLKCVAYEAGPTGYGLARALKAAGLPVMVAAPGKTPRPANQGSKTDRLDCIELAEHAAKNDLKGVAIPTEVQEADRQVVRLRGQLVSKLRRVKQQIKGFLLYYGLEEPVGRGCWSAQGISALGQMKLLAPLRFALDILLEELKHLADMLKRVEKELQQTGAEARHREQQERLQTHPGVGWRTAMTYRMELFRPERFESQEDLARYLGLAPAVRDSGQKHRAGHVIRAGCGQLRAMLVEASWRWVRDDPGARRVYRRIVRNTGSAKKAIVAMARRMGVNLWLMLLRKESYRPAV